MSEENGFNVKEIKERVNIMVKFDIEYDANDPSSREYAIKKAIEDATSCATYGYPVTVRPISAREVKKAKRKKK